MSVEEVSEHKKLLKHKILHNDLSSDHAKIAIEMACEAISDSITEKDIAKKLKNKFETEYEGCWHVLVGSNFGCSLTHKTKSVLRLQIVAATCTIYVIMFQSD